MSNYDGYTDDVWSKISWHIDDETSVGNEGKNGQNQKGLHLGMTLLNRGINLVKSGVMEENA